ncbi:NAD-dependent epimerase/dehydratase family protein [Actinomadura flavalba]|uniref:NAD-dependent epimerase/dehydratase family protein n=1 Tax=Actinomadura flavalba TaxID=1120938 RepID=UPI0003783F9D|nr:NAD-dependent epimerase/dehydratase family protein [Actinomadura flavalba]
MVVTGAAGFVGSHVVEAVARDGLDVVAVDAPRRSLTPGVTRERWRWLGGRAGVVPLELDLAVDDLAPLAAADVVVHLAGRPGVRDSWGPGEAAVERDNVVASRRLLEACARRGTKVVVASSSSVYGPAGARASREDDPLAPASPYARSKAEVERLARAAADAGLPVTVLRYFSVYGPRQRPDMAFHRFIAAALAGRPLPVFGDGTALRSFTHVGDVVTATTAAVRATLPPGTVVNVGSGEPTSVNDAIALISDHLGIEPRITAHAPIPGDVPRTHADPTRAAALLDWTPAVPLDVGLKDQITWQRGAP